MSVPIVQELEFLIFDLNQHPVLNTSMLLQKIRLHSPAKMLTCGCADYRWWPWTAMFLLIRQWFKAAFLCCPALWVFMHIYCEKEILLDFRFVQTHFLYQTEKYITSCISLWLSMSRTRFSLCMFGLHCFKIYRHLVCFNSCLTKYMHEKYRLMGQEWFYVYHRN